MSHPSSRIAIFALALFSVCWGVSGCRTVPREPVTISFLDPEWSHDTSTRSSLIERDLQEFTKETGIQVHHLPAPEGSAEQLQLTRRLLGKGSADVYAIDVVWPGILKDSLLDLKPYFTDEMAKEDPELMSNFTVQNRLVAVPLHANVGVLYFRPDLLRKYGFSHPPRTWGELEKMAEHIQAGERAQGNRDFWGYLWAAGSGEALTCDALEWQYSEGGGHVIEADGKISVNNPQAIRSWERAAGWIGRISPPATLSYQEWDSINSFRYAQKGAFFRGWASDYFLSTPVETSVWDKEGVTAMPGGAQARVGAFGGVGLAVGQTSAHREEALQLVKFLLRKESQLDQQRHDMHPAGQLEMVELPAILKAYSTASQSTEQRKNSVVARPSTVTGEKYEKVSLAYSQAVRAVLGGKVKASAAAANLEKELEGIMGSPSASSAASN